MKYRIAKIIVFAVLVANICSSCHKVYVTDRPRHKFKYHRAGREW